QKLEYYDGFALNQVEQYIHTPIARQWLEKRFPALVKGSLPRAMLLVFLPGGLLYIAFGKRWVPAAVLPLFVAVYAPSVTFDSIYGLPVAVATIPLVILGARALAVGIAQIFPGSKSYIGALLGVLLLGISLANLPQLNPAVTEQYASPTLQAVEQELAKIPGRAVVFFRYRHGDNVHEEPVYNIDAADIDSNRIVRAQDLGPRENI